MQSNSRDETIKHNYLQKFRFLIAEYELVKAKKHPRFRFGAAGGRQGWIRGWGARLSLEFA